MTIANGRSRFPLAAEQIDAWKLQLPALRACTALLGTKFDTCTWGVLLEYPIPLLGDRLDCVLLCGAVIVVLEFKSGELSSSAARRQVEDYAANLANFHEGSESRVIEAIVAAGETAEIKDYRYSAAAGHYELPEAVLQILSRHPNQTAEHIDIAGWDNSRFKPVPPIINAAVQLYEHKDVFAIEHACSPAESLTEATEAIVNVVQSAQKKNEKTICFVTGVPGAGKTLVGLNTVHDPRIQESSTFLSGNGPLIKVIREACCATRENEGAYLGPQPYLKLMRSFTMCTGSLNNMRPMIKSLRRPPSFSTKLSELGIEKKTRSDLIVTSQNLKCCLAS